MNEEITDRLCGLIARLRQQHAAIGATLDEIEACLAEPPPEQPKTAPAAARSARGAAAPGGPRPAGQRSGAPGRVAPRPATVARR
jgi:hypothetical protein